MNRIPFLNKEKKMGAKKLGIWMDHANANLMEFASGASKTKTLSSDFTFQDKEHSLSRSEKQMHNKEQQQQKTYYKKLGEVIAKYDEVLLFGPTNAKAELFNIIKLDHRFANIKIEIKESDKLTPNQQLAFVRDYFQKTASL